MDQYSDIEKQIVKTSKSIVINIRGNQAGNGKAIIYLELIGKLHNQLEIYKKQIEKDQLVNKDIVGLLFYTCTRFYHQSKYSLNAEELIEQYEKLYTKLLELYLRGL